MHQALACLISEISVLCQACRKQHFPSFFALEILSMGDQFKALWGDWRIGGEKKSGYFYPQFSWLWITSPGGLASLWISRFWRWPWSLGFGGTTFSLPSSSLKNTVAFFHHWSLACFSVPLWLLSSSNTHATSSCIKFPLFKIPRKSSVFWLCSNWYISYREKKGEKINIIDNVLFCQALFLGVSIFNFRDISG